MEDLDPISDTTTVNPNMLLTQCSPNIFFLQNIKNLLWTVIATWPGQNKDKGPFLLCLSIVPLAFIRAKSTQQ